MARAKVLCTSAFLLVLILSYGLVFPEGRQLSNNSGNGGGSDVDSGGGSVADGKESIPVGPGHSPGVGHSVGPARANP
ncbi:hypothetical protein RHGRI_016221 [Rhododendron griersonianum]|uniref:Glycine-rich protein n=1 Tax=Rhododendron griersonianum TaxID=479676 RepID=A0AAV6JRG8_9ERIC|nr:hypothetical protein RHGRI_016221 [Rhododendron griersonianum]